MLRAVQGVGLIPSAAHMTNALAPCVDADRFKAAMRRVVSAVHIVTTGGPAGEAGLTVSAVTALADTPASLLVCINRQTATAGLFLTNQRFCVNTLSAQDGNLASEFGTKGLGAGRSVWGPRWRVGHKGIPVLREAAVVQHCRVVQVLTYETHYLIIGQVVDIEDDSPARSVLAYVNRRYQPIELFAP